LWDDEQLKLVGECLELKSSTAKPGAALPDRESIAVATAKASARSANTLTRRKRRPKPTPSNYVKNQ
jgi:hypothetical protein